MTRKPDHFLTTLERRLDKLGHVVAGERAWPVAMAVLGAGAITAALVVYPGNGEQMMIFGLPFGSECTFKAEQGYGCPGCGMTRSWVYSARGQIMRAMTYNPAGSTLFLWLALGLPMGVARLVLRNSSFLRTPPFVFLGLVALWMAGCMVVFGLRMFGINPLP